MEPKISVIVTVYNHEKYLEQALNGIESQDFDGKIEVIIHDDASTDGSLEICQRFAGQSKHVFKIIRQASNKFSKKLSFLPEILELCTGDAIATCEGDDFWTMPLKLAHQWQALELLPNVDICFHRAFRVGMGVDSTLGYICDYGYDPQLFAPSVVIEGDGGFMPTASILFRRRALDHYPAWLYESPQPPVLDYFIQVFGALQGGALYLPMCAAAYREGDPNAWTQQVRSSAEKLDEFEVGYLESLIKLRQSLGFGYQQNVDKLLLRTFINHAVRCYTQDRLDRLWSTLTMMQSVR